MSFNKVTIFGHLGKDPELRFAADGKAICNISVATSEKRKDKSGTFQDVTLWFKVVTFGKQAENAAKYLSKGSQAYFEGRLRLEEWSDRDGKNRTTLEVIASDMQFIGKAEAREDSTPTHTGTEEAFDSPMVNAAPGDDDIPF